MTLEQVDPMSFLASHRARYDEILAGLRCVRSDGSSPKLDHALEWLAERAGDVRRSRGSVFFIGIGAGDPQSHHFAAAFYRRIGLRGIALGETPFRSALGDPVRAAETLAQWFAKPGDLVIDLLESTPPDRARALLEDAATLGLRTVAFARRRAGEAPTPIGELTFYIPSDDPCVCDSIQHFIVNAWIAYVRSEMA